MFERLLIVFVFASTCVADDGWRPTYGFEFNFSNAAINAEFEGSGGTSDSLKDKSASLFLEALKGCSECIVRNQLVIHSSGFFFEVGTDPAVVEVRTAPITLMRLNEFEDLIQSLIFDTAKKVSLGVTDEIMHLNIGFLSAFGLNKKKFLQFFVDHSNRPWLWSGILGDDFDNAPPFAALDPKQKLSLANLVTAVWEKDLGIVDFFSELRSNVYERSPGHDGDRYQAIGIRRLDLLFGNWADKPVELRAITQPRNASQTIRLVELFEARLRYTNSKTAPPIVRLDPFIPLETYEEEASRFKIYLDEIGLNYDHFKSILPSRVQRAQPDLLARNRLALRNQDDIATLERYVGELPYSDLLQDRVISTLMHRQSTQELVTKATARIRETFSEHSDLIQPFKTKLRSEAERRGCSFDALSF